MLDRTADQEQILKQLRAFTPENFRRQRWVIIDRARKAGLEWDDIAEALDSHRPSVIRMYKEVPPASY